MYNDPIETEITFLVMNRNITKTNEITFKVVNLKITVDNG